MDARHGVWSHTVRPYHGTQPVLVGKVYYRTAVHYSCRSRRNSCVYTMYCSMCVCVHNLEHAHTAVSLEPDQGNTRNHGNNPAGILTWILSLVSCVVLNLVLPVVLLSSTKFSTYTAVSMYVYMY